MSSEQLDSGESESVQNSSWIQSTRNNPVVRNLQSAIRANSLQTGIPSFIFINRQNSFSTGRLEERLYNMDHRIRSAPSSSTSATVINIDDIVENRNTICRPSPCNRRHSSNSSGQSDNFAREIVPELSNLAAQLFNTNNAARRIQSPSFTTVIDSLAGITSDTTNSNPSNYSSVVNHTAFNSSNEESVGSPGRNETPHNNHNGENDARNDDFDQPNNNYTLPSLRMLFQSRDAVGQYIYQNLTEFPNLHGFNVLVLFVVVITILFSKFLIENFAACGTLSLGLLHYQDATRFMRCVSGASEIYFTLGMVLLRNAMIFYVFDKHFILSAATFHDEISFLSNPTIFSTVYRIISTELFVMDVTLTCKLIISISPLISKIYKRRVYQWLEYTCALYRYPIPFVQWCYFFDGMFWATIYFIAKFFIGFPIIWSWLRTTVRLFHYSHLGTMPSTEDIKNVEQCTICYGELTSPLKLNCGHVFCSDCIRTWLDREVTCPICRATVSKEDNHYRNGNSIFPMHIF